MTSLFVGNLHDDVTRDILHEKFIRFGKIFSIHIVRDRHTNLTRGYGYINFQHHSDASKAFDQMDGEELMERKIRIAWSDDYKFVRRNQDANVLITNLNPAIDEEALWETFYDFMLLSCKVDRDANGNSKGLAYVQFRDEDAARYFIEKIDGKLLNEMQVNVKIFRSLSTRQRDRENTFTNIFVKNFGDKLDKVKLKALFEAYGKVKDVAIMKGSNNISKGYGFVAMENHTEAQNAVNEMNGRQVAGVGKLYVARAQKKREREITLRREFEKKIHNLKGLNVFVKNLPDTLSDDQLQKEFKRFGTVTSAKVMRHGGMSKGFGFVCFSSREEANNAVADMNGNYIDDKQIYASIAQRRDERRAILKSQFRNKTRKEMVQQNQLQLPNQQVIQPGYAMAAPAVTSLPPQSTEIVHQPTQYFQAPNDGNQVIPPTACHPQQISEVPYNQFTSSPYVPEEQHLSQNDQKFELGKRLYPLICAMQPNLASTVTGMVMECNNFQLLELLENPDLLAFTVQKTVDWLQQRH